MVGWEVVARVNCRAEVLEFVADIRRCEAQVDGDLSHCPVNPDSLQTLALPYTQLELCPLRLLAEMGSKIGEGIAAASILEESRGRSIKEATIIDRRTWCTIRPSLRSQ